VLEQQTEAGQRTQLVSRQRAIELKLVEQFWSRRCAASYQIQQDGEKDNSTLAIPEGNINGSTKNRQIDHGRQLPSEN
jgi:hypothetical protein